MALYVIFLWFWMPYWRWIQFYHATCRAEQTSALKRLKAADPNRRTSSSASPRTTPSNEGLKPEAQKRKVEGMDIEHEEGSKRVKVEEIVGDI